MDNQTLLYIDRLSLEKTESIDEVLSPNFIEVDENELQFPSPVLLKGKAYIANSHLILELNFRTSFLMPCAICNQMVEKKMKIDSFYHAEELANIRDHVYNYKNLLREAILLELPLSLECSGNCPQRDKLNPYIKEKNQQFPFKDLI